MAHLSMVTLATLLTVAWLVAGCASPATPTPIPTPTPPFGLPPLTLPADEEPHDFQTEWWYFNLHLTGEEGERFTLHDVVFQVREQESGRTLYVRQTGLADVAAQTHVNSERLRPEFERLSAPARDAFEFEMGDWLMAGSSGQEYVLRASAGNYSYALTLTDTTSPLLHGAQGLVDFGYAGVSYYYTRPRLSVAGVLTLPDGRALPVTGLAWLDKQWGNFQPVIVGWDWASIQLDDGTDVMLSRLFDMDRNELHYYATVRLPGGERAEVGEREGLEFAPFADTWTSPATGITYHTRWEVRIPSHGLELTLEPLVEGAEFASQVLGVTYWEAGVDVMAPDGTRLGQGFIELNWPRGAAPPVR